MAKRRSSAHAAVDELRQDAAAERMKQRDLEVALEEAKLEVEQASAAISNGYVAEDQRAVTASRKAEEAAMARVKELAHRLTGAEIRVQRAQQQVDAFQCEHAKDLLQEREQAARTVAAELTASVHETVRLARAYLSERTAQDALVAAVPGATPRSDGPAAAHPWEAELRALARAVSETPEAPAPLPRWHGLGFRRQEDNTARRLQLQRRKRLTADEQAELERLNLTPGAPVAVGSQQ